MQIPAHNLPAPEQIGVLLVNSGTPNSASTADVRSFLGRLLGDPRVVELPCVLWWPILHGIILRTRPWRSARKYRKVWTPDGSPLLLHTNALRERLAVALGRHGVGPVAIEVAMLYAQPEVDAAIQRLCDAGARRVLIVPMFPQYSAVTTGAVFDRIAKVMRGWRWIPELRFVAAYHDHPAYIAALKESILQHWNLNARTEHVVISFHGIPKRYFDQGDPYYCFCHKSARLLAEALSLPDGGWTLAFQSRFGPGGWLKPYADEVLESLPRRGVREVTVVSPGFAVDCLETLEEIAIDGRKTFLNAGGTRFEYVPALNSSERHAQMFAEIVSAHISGWGALPDVGLR